MVEDWWTNFEEGFDERFDFEPASEDDWESVSSSEAFLDSILRRGGGEEGWKCWCGCGEREEGGKEVCVLLFIYTRYVLSKKLCL